MTVLEPGPEQKVLWRPKDVSSTRVDRFRRRVNEIHGINLSKTDNVRDMSTSAANWICFSFKENYAELWQWSIDNIADFWVAVWEETNIIASRRWDSVLEIRFQGVIELHAETLRSRSLISRYLWIRYLPGSKAQL
jgi:hypothetical protein